MENRKNIKTIISEYVSYGHPDKMADQISDAILDAFIEKDPNARTGIETMVKDNIVVLGGEINSTATVDYDTIVRDVYSTFPFPKNHGLDPDNIKIINLIGKQSPEIHSGVDKSDTIIGAGDQGFVVGYASNSTEENLPYGYYLAKKICNIVCYTDGMGPDTKSQVVVEYEINGEKLVNPVIKSILVSTMHSLPLKIVRTNVKQTILSYVKDNNIKVSEDFRIDVNPCGSWQTGGPVSDCGITGRKIVVDHYGGYSNVGGGAFSGKDGSKVDRSAAYMARYLAVNIVNSGLCNKAKVELAYMIGEPNPVAMNIEMDENTDLIPQLKEWLMKNVDMTPYGIIQKFSLDKPNFFNLSRNGHFGDPKLPWEKTDLAENIKNI